MNLNLKPAVRWWGERKTRERLLLLAGGTAAVLVAGDALVTAPAERRLKQARVAVQAQQGKLDAALTAAGAGPAAADLRAQARALQQRIQVAQTTAQALRLQASEAARLPETLRAITATVGSARLLALELTGDAAPPPAAASAAAGTADPPPAAAMATAGKLYRLPITLKVSGTYEELHMLLTQIERHAEALQWTSLTLDNSEWPAIQLTLKAHVLSPDPRWGAAS